MTLRERLARWIAPQNRISVSDPAYALRSLPVYSAGVSLTGEGALQVSALFGCIARITNALAPHPWEVHEIVGQRRTLKPDDAVTYLLNKRPNPSTTAVAFRQALLRSCMAGDGNAYAEIQKDNAGRTVALWPLEPERVVPEVQADGTLYYRIYQYQGGSVDVEASRIFHLRGIAAANGIVGDNVVYRAATVLGIASAAQQFAAQYYANGTISSGVLKHSGNISLEVVERLREQWRQNHSGVHAAHSPMFLEEGVEWESLEVDAEKTQLHEARSFAVEEIARYFGVPLHLLGVAQSAQGYGTNVSQLGLEFRRYTLEPWAAALQQEADFKLFPQRAPWRETRIDLSMLTAGDGKTEAETLAVLKKAGFINQNEGREQLGYNTVGKAGDVYTVESTVKTVEQLIDPPEPAPKALPAPAKPMEPPSDEPMNVVHESAALLFAEHLDAYGKVLKNRAADLTRNAPEKAAANLAAERERQRARLTERCAGALGLLQAHAGMKREAAPEILAVADAVEQGEPPRLAADRLVAKLLEAAP